MPKPKAEYRLSPEAESDMDNIWDYTAEEWGREQADRYARMLTERCSELAMSPETGKAVEVREGYHRGVVGKHAIYYRIVPYGIAVVRILHERMSVSRHLPHWGSHQPSTE